MYKIRILVVWPLLAVITISTFFPHAVYAEPPSFYNDGAPYFPIGIFDYPGIKPPNSGYPVDNSLNVGHEMELQSAGVLFYYGELWRITQQQLDTVNSYYLDIVGEAAGEFHSPSQHVPGSAFEQKINLVKNHPGFFMYFTRDEPYWCYVRCCEKDTAGKCGPNWNNLLSGKSFVEARDMTHKIWCNEVSYSLVGTRGLTHQGFVDWSAVGSAYGMDRYPVTGPEWRCVAGGLPDGSKSDLAAVGRDTDAAISVSGGNKPIIMTLQGQGLAEDDTNPCNDRPRPNWLQTRFMAYDAVIHGAKGLAWWGLAWVPSNSQLWLDIKRAAGELRDLQNVLVTPRQPGAGANNPNIEIAYWIVGGDRYVIAANRSNSTINNVTITANGWNYSRNGNRTVEMFQGRTIPTFTNSWSNNFGPWGVRVYTDKSTRRIIPKNDYDGDGRSDLVIWNGSNWKIRYGSRFPSEASYNWGTSGDISVPGDYDGDKRMDIAVFRPSNATWYILKSTTGYNPSQAHVQVWGAAGDVPITGDYDGDRKTDLTIFRPSTSQWFIMKSSSGFTQFVNPVPTWGVSTDIPIAGDYDADGKTDIAVYRQSNGGWYVRRSSDGQAWEITTGWGVGTQYAPVSGDFDGDGWCDPTVVSADGAGRYLWEFRRTDSLRPWVGRFYHGWTIDQIYVGSFDFDRKTDIVLQRPDPYYEWWILRSTENHQLNLAGNGTVAVWGYPGYVTVGKLSQDYQTAIQAGVF